MEQSRRKLKRIENLLRNIIKICSPLGTGGMSNSFCRVGSPMIAPRYILHTGSLAEKGALWAQLWWSQVTSFSRWLQSEPPYATGYNHGMWGHVSCDFIAVCLKTSGWGSLDYLQHETRELENVAANELLGREQPANCGPHVHMTMCKKAHIGLYRCILGDYRFNGLDPKVRCR